MNDYDKFLMEPCNWEQLGANMDRPVESVMGSGMASADVGSEAGVPTRTIINFSGPFLLRG